MPSFLRMLFTVSVGCAPLAIHFLAFSASTLSDEADKKTYIVNTKTKKFHNPDCDGAKKMSSSNKKKYKGTRDSLISNGYSPCQKCKP
jgi:DNA-entry nuclease